MKRPIIYADAEELVAAVTDARGCNRAAITKLNRSLIESAFYLLLIISFSKYVWVVRHHQHHILALIVMFLSERSHLQLMIQLKIYGMEELLET